MLSISCAVGALWLSVDAKSTNAAGGSKSVQVTIVGTDGKVLKGAHVELLRSDGKPMALDSLDKQTWMIKDAADKIALAVRSGRDHGVIELVLPANGPESLAYTLTLSGSELRAELLQRENPSPVVKPDLDSFRFKRSISPSFGEVNRPPSGPVKGPSAGLSNAPVRNVQLLVPPSNDNCANAIAVGSLPATIVTSNVDATDDIGSAPACGNWSNGGPFKNIWYTVVGTGAPITISTCNAGTAVVDTKISVFCNDCSDRICVGGDDDACGSNFGTFKSIVTFCSEAGRTYIFTVGNYDATVATGAIELNVTSSGTACSNPPACQRPANDTCTAATPVGPLPATVNANNGAANSNIPVGGSCGNFTTGPFREIWYSVVGTGGTLTASTCNAATAVTDTKVSVFCADCAAPACVGGDDDLCGSDFGTFKSIFTWCSEIGRTYYIAVGNYSATTTSGNISLVVTDAGGTCTGAPNCGPPINNCGNDTCETAETIASLPFNATGDSCECTHDYEEVCPYNDSAKDLVYSYTPTQDECVDISLCGNSDYDTKVYVYQDSCTSAVHACNDDACSSPLFANYVSQLETVHLTAGHTYYIVVDGYDLECGNYTLDVTSVTCPAPCGVCPPGGVAENEPNCGIPNDTTNGGCNSAPEVFSPIACGQTVCGTAAWDGSFRDTDWYEVTVATATEFTFSVEAEFDAVIGLVNSSDCATATALDPFAFGAGCDALSVTVCLQPGTYWFLVLPDFNGPTFACGGSYTATLSCVGCTPPTCQGETCETAEVIPSTPFSGTGDTCICADNYDEVCPYDGLDAPEKVYVYTPTVDECVDISLCAGSNYDTKVYVYQDTCGTFQSGTQIACNDDECSSPTIADFVSEVTGVNLLAGHTYYIVVDGYGDSFGGPQCGDYTIDIGPCAPPCDITCSPTATPENEPNCGLPDDTVNGGCLNDPPIFSPLACGQSYCGTAAFDGAFRDTDWFQVVALSSTRFTWTATSEFASLTGPVPTSPAGSGNCADLLGVVDPALFGVECTPASVQTECMPAGTYWFFMGATFDDIVECGKEYEVSLSCEPCVIPLGACCRADGSCSENVAESQCPSPDTWQGDATVCANVSCPQPPANDLCDEAITVGTPSTTAGSTQLASTDTGYPDCGDATITSPGVWYTVMGTGNTMTASLCNAATGFDTKLSVFCPSCAEAVCVGGNDDFCGLQSEVTWCSQAGQAYQILVHGFGGATGPFELGISDDGAACPTPASCEEVPVCPGVGSCCEAHATPGCDDQACCESVCACDSFCCDFEWDVNCVGPNQFVPGCSATETCTVCEPVELTGGCCQGSSCIITTQAACNGEYLGDNTDCSGPGAGNPVVYESDVNMDIPDNGGPGNAASHTIMVPDSINVGDVNIDLVVTHTWVGDLIVTVEHNGTTVTVIDRMGNPATAFGCDSNDLNIVLDGSGTGGSIEDLCGAGDDAPVPTSPPNYVPSNPLSAFNGMSASGAWTITVSDNAGFDTGTLDHWSVHIDQPGPSPCIPTGACCSLLNTCEVVSEANCEATPGSVYLGDDVDCLTPGPVTNYVASVNIAIPDNGGPGNAATHTISVPDSYTVADLDVDLVVTHTWVGDLIVTVEHGGTSATIIDRIGVPATAFGCDSNDLDVVTDDEATGGAIEGNCGPSDDDPTPTSPPNYSPENPLSVFDGMNSAGNWTITVSDNAGFDTGTVTQWSLHIGRAGASPCECGDCNDNIACTVDSCQGGQCVHAPNNAACNDGLACNGVETCNPTTGCVAGTPVNCGDGVACTVDACTEPSGTCTHTPNNAFCGDGLFCNGTETCTLAGCIPGTSPCTVDQTCDEVTDECLETGQFTPIPTVSQWGLASLALLLLIGAKIYFARREELA